jgi:hypothetical protein
MGVGLRPEETRKSHFPRGAVCRLKMPLPRASRWRLTCRGGGFRGQTCPKQRDYPRARREARIWRAPKVLTQGFRAPCASLYAIASAAGEYFPDPIFEARKRGCDRESPGIGRVAVLACIGDYDGGTDSGPRQQRTSSGKIRPRLHPPAALVSRARISLCPFRRKAGNDRTLRCALSPSGRKETFGSSFQASRPGCHRDRNRGERGSACALGDPARADRPGASTAASSIACRFFGMPSVGCRYVPTCLSKGPGSWSTSWICARISPAGMALRMRDELPMWLASRVHLR